MGLCTIIKLLSPTLLYTCSMNNTLGLMGNKMGRRGSHSEGRFPLFISEVLVNLSQHLSIFFYLCNSTRRAGSQSKLVRSEVHRVTAHHNTLVYKGNLGCCCTATTWILCSATSQRCSVWLWLLRPFEYSELIDKLHDKVNGHKGKEE